MADPLSRLRGRFDRAIEWRVRASLERAIALPTAETSAEAAERDSAQETAVRAMHDDLTAVSVQLTDQYRALAELVERLDQRLTTLERRDQSGS